MFCSEDIITKTFKSKEALATHLILHLCQQGLFSTWPLLFYTWVFCRFHFLKKLVLATQMIKCSQLIRLLVVAMCMSLWFKLKFFISAGCPIIVHSAIMAPSVSTSRSATPVTCATTTYSNSPVARFHHNLL